MNLQILNTFGRFFLLFALSISFYSCNQGVEVKEEVKNIPLDLEIVRFDRELSGSTAKDFPELRKKYPYLFPSQYPDSIWRQKFEDTIQIEVLNEVGKAFPDFSDQKEELELLFKHIKFYFPRIDPPKVITLTNDVEYQYRVILTDTLLLIGLDNYLGSDHKFYQGFQKYIAANLDKQFLVSDVAGAFTSKILNYPTERTFLSKMIYYGKELYIKEKLLPLATDAQKMGYSQEQLDWALANEEQIWRYFVERELLYSTDNKLEQRFLDIAPFSKFGLELIDSESPPRIGRYMGWQIVRAYMDKTDLTLQQLLKVPAEEIFRKSNYKPAK